VRGPLSASAALADAEARLAERMRSHRRLPARHPAEVCLGHQELYATTPAAGVVAVTCQGSGLCRETIAPKEATDAIEEAFERAR
jgi:hypothetical protein